MSDQYGRDRANSRVGALGLRRGVLAVILTFGVLACAPSGADSGDTVTDGAAADAVAATATGPADPADVGAAPERSSDDDAAGPDTADDAADTGPDGSDPDAADPSAPDAGSSQARAPPTDDPSTDGPGTAPPDDEAPPADEAPPTAAPPTTDASGAVLVSALLSEITVAPERSGGYDRSLFRHWTTSNGCTTRSRVLIRDSAGTAVVNSSCTVTGGTWFSPFDGVWIDVPRSLDIDHVVPIAEAWRSGARDWDESTRRAFANDLSDPRSLIAVSASSNRSKGDRDPAGWLPSHREYRCEYVGTWVAIKHTWELSIDAQERAAIVQVLDGCGELRTAPTVAARPTIAPPSTSGPAASEPAPAPAPAESCVDVNVASSADLQRITGIGPAIAQRVIDARPFASVDALTRVSGIGDVRLADMKAQGLACVN